MSWPGAIVAGLAPALFWLAWIRAKDRLAPEPRRLVALVFALGAASTLVVLALRPPLEDLLPPGNGVDRAILDAFAVTAPLEECAKALALVVVLFHREFDEPLDGIVYGAAAGLGFASVENALYVALDGSATIALTRGVTSTLVHFATSGSLGFLLGLAKFTRGGLRIALGCAAFVVAIGFHGAYDVFLFADGDLGWISLVGVLPLMLVVVGLKIRWTRTPGARIR